VVSTVAPSVARALLFDELELDVPTPAPWSFTYVEAPGPPKGPNTCRTGIPSGHIRSQEWSPMLTQTDEVLAGTLLESSPTKEAVFSWAAALRNAGAQSALNAVNRSPTFQPNGLCQRGHLTHRGVLCSPMGFAAEGAWPTRGTFKPIMGFATEGA